MKTWWNTLKLSKWNKTFFFALKSDSLDCFEQVERAIKNILFDWFLSVLEQKQLSWYLLHRSCWVAPEISTLRTSPRMEVTLTSSNSQSVSYLQTFCVTSNLAIFRQTWWVNSRVFRIFQAPLGIVQFLQIIFPSSVSAPRSTTAQKRRASATAATAIQPAAALAKLKFAVSALHLLFFP